MKVIPGHIYKCNCGGVWMALEERPAFSIRPALYCRLVGAWMEDVVYRRDVGTPWRIEIRQGDGNSKLPFDADGGVMDSNMRLIEEILP